MSQSLMSWLTRRPGCAEDAKPESMEDAVSARSEQATATPPDEADLYSTAMPSHQNAVDLLPGWMQAFPPETEVVAGDHRFDLDTRIAWAIERFGPLADKRVLELGPLEGHHTAILERRGARRIDAIEGNKLAYLRCLVTKEIYDLRRSHFYLGDFVRGLERPVRYDLIVACGVLYHMSDPLLLLERIAARTDAVFLWTHYFDDEEMPKTDPRRRAFQSPQPPHEEVTLNRQFHGLEVTLHQHSYFDGRRQVSFCGGPLDRHFWMEKSQLIAALRALGFDHISFANVEPNHQNGPAISIFARRTSS